MNEKTTRVRISGIIALFFIFINTTAFAGGLYISEFGTSSMGVASAGAQAVASDAWLSEALVEMSAKGLGMTAIVDDTNSILGIYTDGDLRRTLDTGADIRSTTIRDVMHTDCKTTSADVLAAEALHLLEENKITSLLVADTDNRLVGALNIHDLFREGLM